LDNYLEKEKPFLNNDFKLNDLAVVLGTNRQYLSQIINENYNKNFYTLINEYRIKEAIKMFSEEKHKQLSIMGVASSVGFNSKSTFNTLFKKYTGKTPSKYISEDLARVIDRKV
jgi:AraC-like DNA-binding protein